MGLRCGPRGPASDLLTKTKNWVDLVVFPWAPAVGPQGQQVISLLKRKWVDLVVFPWPPAVGLQFWCGPLWAPIDAVGPQGVVFPSAPAVGPQYCCGPPWASIKNSRLKFYLGSLSGII